MKNDELILEYVQTRGLNEDTTYRAYKNVLNHYSKFQQKTLWELLLEADLEEETINRWKHRKLKNRLTNYINHCKSTISLTSTKQYLKMVKSFYYHHEITIGKLPPINKKNAKVTEPLTPSDILTKEEIKLALEISDPLMKAVILHIATSGMSKSDCLNLTINDFIVATAKFHSSTNIVEVIKTLQSLDMPVIATWKKRRKKTNKYYITFTTNESVKATINYLTARINNLKRKDQTLNLNDPLFKIQKHYFTRKFQKINDTLQLGKAGNYNRFRGHMLRKYNATSLKKAGMSRDEINILQGKSNGAVDDVYFFEDEDYLLQKYQNAMAGVLFFDVVKEINIKSNEYRELENQNKKLKERLQLLDEVKADVDEIKKWYVY